jgi:hypothetical protein
MKLQNKLQNFWKWHKNKKKVVKKLIANYYYESTPITHLVAARCNVLLMKDYKGNRSCIHSPLKYPYENNFEMTLEYQEIIFPWLNGEDFDLNGNPIIPKSKELKDIEVF